MSGPQPEPRIAVLVDVIRERQAQDAKWGEQNHLDGTGLHGDELMASAARAECQRLAALDRCTWRAVLAEEVFEAFAESEPDELRAELVQVAAVAVQWVEAIDRRTGRVPSVWRTERRAAYARARALGTALMGGLAVALPALVILAWLAWA